MNRIILPELEDFGRLPRWLRDGMTGYLRAAIALSKPYAVVATPLADLIRASGSDHVVDLASGGGGPWPDLVDALTLELGAPPSVTLTDIHPNQTATTELERLPGISYHRTPVSALAIPHDLVGVRTMFTGLHHFDEGEVISIFRAAQEARNPFLVAEATHRSMRGLLLLVFVPLLVLFLMPRVRPRRMLPLLLTYLPPLLPILIWWDGLASTLKSYRAEELRTLASAIQEPGYAWRVEELNVSGAPIPVTVVIGCPTTS